MEITTYWKASFAPVTKSEDAWIKEVRDVMYDSVKMHMRSDVPVGSFLSGGIDSSIIAKELPKNTTQQSKHSQLVLNAMVSVKSM